MKIIFLKEWELPKSNQKKNLKVCLEVIYAKCLKNITLQIKYLIRILYIKKAYNNHGIMIKMNDFFYHLNLSSFKDHNRIQFFYFKVQNS